MLPLQREMLTMFIGMIGGAVAAVVVLMALADRAKKAELSATDLQREVFAEIRKAIDEARVAIIAAKGPDALTRTFLLRLRAVRDVPIESLVVHEGSMKAFFQMIVALHAAQHASPLSLEDDPIGRVLFNAQTLAYTIACAHQKRDTAYNARTEEG